MPPAGTVTIDLPDTKRARFSIDRLGSPWLGSLLSTLISLAVIAAIALEFNRLSLTHLILMIPRSIPFWIAFTLYYLAGPVSEWIIYRRLWSLPVSGFAALLRKLVSNELLLGYLGEVQFYGWARRRMNMTTTPFGAIKDVTILSALTGNIVTLLMLAVAWPLVTASRIGIEFRTAFISLGIVLGISFIILIFRQRLFTLPRRDLRFIAVVHLVRIFAVIGLAATMWSLVLPNVPISLWLALATLRMLVSRLPIVPNKDVVFAGLAMFLLGHEGTIASLMAMIATLLLATHLCVGAVFSLIGLFEKGARK